MDQNIDANKGTNESIGIQCVIGQKMAIAKEKGVCYETIEDVFCNKNGDVTVLFSNGGKEQFPIEMFEGMICGCHYACFIKKNIPIDDNTSTKKDYQTEILVTYSLPDSCGDVYLPDTTIGTKSKFYNDKMRINFLRGLIGAKMIIQDNDERPIIAQVVKINKLNDELYFTFLNGDKKFNNAVPFHFSGIRIDYNYPWSEFVIYYDEKGKRHQVSYSLHNASATSDEEWEKRRWNLATALFVARNNTMDINSAIAIADEFVQKYITHEND